MAPDFEQWKEVLPNQLVAERDIIQAKVTADRRRAASLRHELAEIEGRISINQQQVRGLGLQITAARELPVIGHPLEVPGTEASLKDFIFGQSASALVEKDDSKVPKYLEAQSKIILAGRRLVLAGFDPDRSIPVPVPKIMILNEQEGVVQIGDDPPMQISRLTALCLGLFYNNPGEEVPVQLIIEKAGGKSGPNTLERWEAKLGIPVFRKVRKEKARTFWSLNLEWVQPLPYIEQIKRKEKTGFAVLDTVVSQIIAQSVPAYLDLHRALGPSGKVDIYSERIHKISDDSQTRMLDFYTADELAGLFAQPLKDLFEQSKEGSKKVLWDDIKVQIWDKIESLMKRFKVSKYDAFLRKLARVIKDSEGAYNEANSIKTPVKSAIL